MTGARLPLGEVWLLDFEFSAPPGERPRPICLVALELRSGRLLRVWEDELRALQRPPYSVDPESVVIAYYASAEVGCHLALGWPPPANIIDLCAEFRLMTNGLPTPCGKGLLGALIYFGIEHLDAAEKAEMQALAQRGGPWTDEERWALLNYCESDVRALERLLPRMMPALDIERALLRGRYMAAAASIEHRGVPIDTVNLARIREHWGTIKLELVRRMDTAYGVFDGTTFKADRWRAWTQRRRLRWPTKDGDLLLDRKTFREMARLDPAVAPIHELRHALSELRLEDLAVGPDGRNRCLLSAFRTKTGRNAPSNTRFIFGPATWIRSLITPPPGSALVYLDYEQQEFGIAAALSGDEAMIAAYSSGDPYLAFAKQAGAVPIDATKESHGPTRDLFKSAALAVQYGMGARSLADRIGRTAPEAEELLRLHRRAYPRFWRWSDGAVEYALVKRRLWTVFGWMRHVSAEDTIPSLQNHLMQSNGAEMLRLACCLGIERGVRIVAPVHDAILFEAPESDLDDHLARAQGTMAEASAAVLGGFELRTDAKVVRHPDRYQDKRGRRMWQTVLDLVGEAEAAA